MRALIAARRRGVSAARRRHRRGRAAASAAPTTRGGRAEVAACVHARLARGVGGRAGLHALELAPWRTNRTTRTKAKPAIRGIEAAWRALEAGDVAEARAAGRGARRGVAGGALAAARPAAARRGTTPQAIALLRRAAAADPEWATPELWLAELLAARSRDAMRARRWTTPSARSIWPRRRTSTCRRSRSRPASRSELGEIEEAKRTLARSAAARGARSTTSTLALEIADLHLAVGEAATARERLRDADDGEPDVGRRLVRARVRGRGARRRGGDARRPGSAPGRSTPRPAPTSAKTAGERRARRQRWRRWPRRRSSELPERARALLRGVPIVIAELPAEADVEDAGSIRGCSGSSAGRPTRDGAHGSGRPAGADADRAVPAQPRARRPRDEDELREEIRTTLLHETGHFFGLDDAALRASGWGWRSSAPTRA